LAPQNVYIPIRFTLTPIVISLGSLTHSVSAKSPYFNPASTRCSSKISFSMLSSKIPSQVVPSVKVIYVSALKTGPGFT
jgi:hypothetical protein